MGDTQAVYPQKVLVYKGGWKAGQKHGKDCELYSKLGFILYQGDFVNGTFHGNGKLYSDEGPPTAGSDGKIYDGGFEKGRKSGIGKLFDGVGNLVYDGKFSNDRYDTGTKKGSEGMLYKTPKDKDYECLLIGMLRILGVR